MEDSALTNEERADIGRRALMNVELDISRDELPTSIVDLVANLLHLAREYDLKPDDVIATAQMHFDAEVAEEAEAKT